MEVKKMISKEQAFANIKKSCEEQLHKIYCAGVPDFALERFNKEIEMLKNQTFNENLKEEVIKNHMD